MEFSFSSLETSNKAKLVSSSSLLSIQRRRDVTPKREGDEITRPDVTPKHETNEITRQSLSSKREAIEVKRRDVTPKKEVKDDPKREINLTKTKVAPRRILDLSSKVIYNFI